MQQFGIQQTEGMVTQLPFTQVISDLVVFIEKYKSMGDEINLCLDETEKIKMNEECNIRGTMTQLTKETALVCAHDFLGYQ